MRKKYGRKRRRQERQIEDPGRTIEKPLSVSFNKDNGSFHTLALKEDGKGVKNVCAV